MKEAVQIRNALLESISEVNDNRSKYCTRKGRDHTRTRKLPFDTTINVILSMVNKSLQLEIYDYFNSASDSPTKSAFIQQRQKISPDAFRAVFDAFSKKCPASKRFNGYRLLACDGSDINLPRNPQDKETSAQANPDAKSYNILHLNALYDLINRTYVDYSFDYGASSYEGQSLEEMAKKICDKQTTIIVADKGYGHLSMIQSLTNSGLNYVLRIKDLTSNGFLNTKQFTEPEFDSEVSYEVTWHRNQTYLNDPKYIIVNKRSKLDFSSKDVLTFSLRVCRFKLPSGGYELLVTNLPKSSFTTEDLKKIYHLRWGIETSFRDLKYAIGMMYFHAKKLNSVLQEIQAALIMMNYCSLIVQTIGLEQKKSWKKMHKINFAIAVGLCRSFFSNGKTDDLNLIRRNQSLIRPDLQYPRNMHDTKPAKPFSYRAS